MRLFTRLNRFGKSAGHDRFIYRDYQRKIGDYYLEQYVKPFTNGKKILDIGCAEGGVLEAFANEGFECAGLEISEQRINYAQEIGSKNITFIYGNIEEIKLTNKYDVILMLDVIEHLVKKRQALENIKRALLPNGICIIAFPQFRSAFGGHQQVMSSFLKFIPFLHLLPEDKYLWLLEHIEKKNVETFSQICRTAITTRQFEKYVSEVGFQIKKKIFHLIRPRQALRFGIKTREYKSKLFRDYIATGVVYILT